MECCATFSGFPLTAGMRSDFQESAEEERRRLGCGATPASAHAIQGLSSRGAAAVMPRLVLSLDANPLTHCFVSPSPARLFWRVTTLATALGGVGDNAAGVVFVNVYGDDGAAIVIILRSGDERLVS